MNAPSAAGRATAREPLSRARIAAAALALIDAEGLDALSMRRLGHALGVEAMSLYNHVRNKDDLLVAVSDVLYTELLASYPPPEGDWRARGRAMVHAWWGVASRHPHAWPLVAERPFTDGVGAAVFAESLRIFVDMGLGERAAGLGFATAASWVVGTINQELRLMPELRAGNGVDLAAVSPELAPIAAAAAFCSGSSIEERLEVGLDVLFAGIGAVLSPPAG